MEIDLEDKDINFIGNGIENCGNSCFMNSINQMLFHIPELREFMIRNIGIFEKSAYKKSDHENDLILKLIGLFMEIKKINNTKVTIKSDTVMYDGFTLDKLYESVQKEYFDNEKDNEGKKKENLVEFDNKYIKIEQILEHFQKYIHSKLSEDSKNEFKLKLVKFLNDNHLEYLKDLTKKKQLVSQLGELEEKEVEELSKENPNQERLKELSGLIDYKKSQIDIEDLNIDRIDYNTIFERIKDHYKRVRKDIYDNQQAASELLNMYLGNDNVGIIDSIITKYFDEIIIYNKNPLARFALNNEFLINKINLPFYDIYIKQIEMKKCKNGLIFNNKIIYESTISFKEKFKITLDDIIDEVNHKDCGAGEDVNTIRRTKYVPNKYIIINVGREYEQVYKIVYKVIKIETDTEKEKELETSFDWISRKLSFKDQGKEKDWDSKSKEYRFEQTEEKCEMFTDGTDTKFRDSKTGVEDLITNLYIYDGLYIKKQEVNDTPIENYNTVKKEMIINYNNGRENIEYELVGTVCKWGEVGGGHYWYHHKINNIWYEFNDAVLRESYPPDPKYMLILLFRKIGASYTIPIYQSLEDMKLHILQQISKNIMTYDNELSDDLSKISKLKGDIERLLYYSSSIGKNTKLDSTLQEIRNKLKQKINSNPILKP